MIRNVVYKPILERNLIDRTYSYILIEKYLNDNLVNLLDSEEYFKDRSIEENRANTYISLNHDLLSQKQIKELLKDDIISMKC